MSSCFHNFVKMYNRYGFSAKKATNNHPPNAPKYPGSVKNTNRLSNFADRPSFNENGSAFKANQDFRSKPFDNPTPMHASSNKFGMGRASLFTPSSVKSTSKANSNFGYVPSSVSIPSTALKFGMCFSVLFYSLF